MDSMVECGWLGNWDQTMAGGRAVAKCQHCREQPEASLRPGPPLLLPLLRPSRVGGEVIRVSSTSLTSGLST